MDFIHEKFFKIIFCHHPSKFDAFFLGVTAWKFQLYSLVALYPFRVPDVIFPFISDLLAAGITSFLLGKFISKQKAAVVYSLVLKSLLLSNYEFQIGYDRFEKRRKEIPFETFQWIKENTPKNSVF
jgi:hypothetical protein